MTSPRTHDWQPLALRLGLEPLGAIPGDLPDAWLMRLERMAGAIGSAAEDAFYRTVLGEGGESEAIFRGLARAWLFTDDLEAAVAARLPAESGPRRRWLEVLRRRCRMCRIEGDSEIAQLTEELEQATWRFHTDVPSELPVSERERLQALSLRRVPLAEANRPTLVQLFKRRNTLARAEGLPSFFELALENHEAPWAWLEPLMTRLKVATDEASGQALAWLSAREPQPITTHWALRAAEAAHTTIPSERLVEVGRALLRSADKALGLPDLGVPHTLVVRPFGVGGLCSVVDGWSDVRLAIDTSRPRHTQLTILLHEYGHALHLAYSSRGSLPFHLHATQHGEPVPICEAMATLLESLKLEQAWLATISDGTPAELDLWAHAAKVVELQAVRYHMMVTAFDREMYRDPDQDLDAMFLHLQQSYLGLQPPSEAGCLWAANPIVISAPCYQVGYVLASVAVYQLRESLGGTVWDNPRVGPFLEEHFWEPAGSVPWRERIEQATGRPLDPEALLRALAPAPGADAMTLQFNA